jgi:hypothetical protein
MHPFQVVPLKNTTVLLIPKNKLCRSFVNSALKLRQWQSNLLSRKRDKIVTDVTITHDPLELGTYIDIQISSGYLNGQDQLTLTHFTPSIKSQWNVSEGN